MSDLPSGWEWSTLGDECQIVNGGTPKTSILDYWNGDIPWITPDDLSRHSGIQISRGRRSITESGLMSSSARMVPSGTVLFTSRAPIGYVAVASADVSTNQGFKNLVPGPRLRTLFLYWHLKCVTPEIQRMGTGTTFKEVSKAAMQKVRIPVPPLEEQDRIVAVLAAVADQMDIGVSQARLAREKLSVLQTHFTRQLFREVGSKSIPLGAIAEVKGGVTKDAGRSVHADSVEVPYLRVANVQRGFFSLSDVATIQVSRSKAKALELHQGDILFNEGGDRDKLGRGWVWENQIENCIHQNHVFRARLTSSEFDPYFVSRLGNTSAEWFEQNGKQTTNLASISISVLKTLPIPHISRQRQREIVARLEDFDDSCRRATRALDRVLLNSEGLLRSATFDALRGQLDLIPKEIFV